MNLRRKVLLSAAGLAAITLPVAFGVVNAPQSGSSSQSEATIATGPRFEVASIKSYESDPVGWHYGFSIADPPNEGTFEATDVTVEMLVRMAYGVQHSWLIQGAPSWLNSERFDIQAKAGSAVNRELRALGPDQGVLVKHRMLQALLAERFKLALHRETKDLPAYALVIAKNGPKLQEAKPSEASQIGIKGPGDGQSIGFGPRQLSGQSIPMAALAELLSQRLGCTVLDRTGLKGKYDFTLQWTPDQSRVAIPMGQESGKPATNSLPPPDSSGPSIFTAIQDQLGLKLESTKGPVEILVIDHIERPSEN